MDIAALKQVADLIARRSNIEAEIATITGRPALPGHLGEWIAAKVFAIDLEASAASQAIDGRFTSGPLAGSTVNIKCYGKREGILDVTEDLRLDYYLVLTGPRSAAASSRGTTRPMLIDAAYLFEAQSLLDTLRARGVKIGVATSVIASLWDAAELFPDQRNFTIPVSREQHAALVLFSTSSRDRSSVSGAGLDVKPDRPDADRKLMAARLLTLRHPDICATCTCSLPTGATAWWDSQANTVTCTVCRPGMSTPPPGFVSELDPGQAGASASREHRRRVERREVRVRKGHPRVGRLLLALSSAPQHETAFACGAQGERTVAAGLQRRLSAGSVMLLHDRRMPKARGNLDHLAVARSGVYVIDAKAHRGKVQIVRPLFGPEKLLIGGRDWTRLLDGLDRQVAAVGQVLASIGSEGVPVQGVLCFTDADLPLLRTAKVRGHLLMYGRALARKLNSGGALTPANVESITGTLAAALPPA